MKNKLAIFDMDGTLFDTKELNFLAYERAFSSCGCAVDTARFRAEFFGRHFSDFLPLFVSDPTPALVERIHETKKACYREFLYAARENAFLFECIEGLKHSAHIALVTTASRKNTEELLRHFGRLEAFELIVTQEDVTRVKPDPEGFLLAMSRFGAAPADTAIFEDSDAGVRCAKGVGASVFKVERF